MLPHQLQSSPRSITCATATVLQVNAILLNEPTQAVDVTYVGALLTGINVDPVTFIAIPLPSGHPDVPQYPIARAGASAGSYVPGSTLTFIGTYNGVPATSVATVVGAGGGADFIGVNPLDTVNSVVVQAQVDGLGSWTLGFTDIACRPGQPYRALRVNAAGNVAVVYAGGWVDLIPFLAGEMQTIEPVRVVQATTTAAGFTLYE